MSEQVREELARGRERFLELVAEIWPDLHRYCSRMTGSVFDGEDVVQDALTKAFYALGRLETVPALRPWLFTIAHHEAVDFVRRRTSDGRARTAHAQDAGEPDEADPVELRELTLLTLSVFLELPPLSRAAVILKDVLGFTLAEIVEITRTSPPAVKAALHRGRGALRKVSTVMDLEKRPLPEISPLLRRYVECFNARDWRGVSDLLAEDVRLDMVAKFEKRRHAEVEGYFAGYTRAEGWRFEVGVVENRPAILVFETGSTPSYFVLLTFAGDLVAQIRDYRYARHVVREAAYRDA